MVGLANFMERGRHARIVGRRTGGHMGAELTDARGDVVALIDDVANSVVP